LPTAVAVSVVIADVPPMFSVPVAWLTNPPAPDSAATTVSIPSLVSVAPELTVIFLLSAVTPLPIIG